MKLLNIIYLCLCFVFILSENSLINKQIGKIVLLLEEYENADFVFDASSFKVGENPNIYFRVKCSKGILDSSVNYVYIDSKEETPGSTTYSVDLVEDTPETTPHSVPLTGTETETLANGTEYDIKYFTIEKKSEEYSGHDGNYIYILINSNSPGYVEITNIAKDTSNKPTTAPTDVMDGIVQKYGTITVDASDYMVVFNVGDFDDGEEMYFKIKAETDAFYWNYIYYEYISSNIGYEDSAAIKSYFSLKSTYETTPNGYSYVTNYFTITKKKVNLEELMELIY